uniref:Anthranilate synthase component 2 n=1 Tax=Porphyridium purpureum TaxID=35688 RepID=W0S1W6_PORPP|nr:anthranilate synthase component II [Porphyridium purpureum]BAO23703.1 anthranilate synthase component II [Porphyridium purpureum]
MILIIDNYDSFTYNLVQYIGSLGYKPIVFRNDQITIDQIRKLDPEKIIISPGPGNPDEAGICLNVVKELYNEFPILGVCLGHQTIGQAFNCKINKAQNLMHGKVSEIYHDQKGIFYNLPNPFKATRYHSLVIDSDSVSNDIEITAWTKDKIIMGCKHKNVDTLLGLQFHPESILTEQGFIIIQNFLNLNSAR